MGSVDSEIRNGVYLLPDSDDPSLIGKFLLTNFTRLKTNRTGHGLRAGLSISIYAD